jgi:hypothetical protein
MSAAGDKAITPKPRGRGKGAWWIQAVAMKRLRPTLGGSQVRDRYGCLVVIGSLDGASPSAPRDEAGIRVASMRVY